jgi:hypothetical protein
VLIDALTTDPQISVNDLIQLTNGCPRTTLRRWKSRAEKEIGHAAQAEEVDGGHAAQAEEVDGGHAAQVALIEEAEESHAA